MILSYRHKGLEGFSKKGDKSKLPFILISKIRLILSRLDSIDYADQMNQPGYNFHSLKGDLKGFYAVKVSGNWRVIFKMEGKNVVEVDFIDYH